VTRSEPVEQVVRDVCLSFPGATERLSHGAPAFFAGKQFVALWVGGHHDNQFPHLWCAAPPGAQEGFIAGDPERYFRPPYVGSRGWLGMRLDGNVDPDEVAIQCEEAFRTVASARLIAQLDSQP
jgi:hypothetical protein